MNGVGKSIVSFILLFSVIGYFKCQEQKVIIKGDVDVDGHIYSMNKYIGKLPYKGKVNMDLHETLLVITENNMTTLITASDIVDGVVNVKPTKFNLKLSKDSIENIDLDVVEGNMKITFVVGEGIGNNVLELIDFLSESFTGYLGNKVIPFGKEKNEKTDSKNVRFSLKAVFQNQEEPFEKFSGAGTKKENFGYVYSIQWVLYDKKKDEIVYEKTHIGASYIGRISTYEAGNRGLKVKGQKLTAKKHAIKEIVQRLLSDSDFFNAIKLKKNIDQVYSEALNLIDKKYIGPKNIDEVINSVVTIKTLNGFGSAFVINKEGYLLTNYHVVQGMKKINVIFSNGMDISGELIRYNVGKDVALIKVGINGLSPLNISNKLPSTGDDVFAIGTPERLELGQSASKGIVSGKPFIENIQYIQTDVSINHGNSGGPLVNKNGAVLGIVTAKLVGKGVEGIGFVIPIKDALVSINCFTD